MYQMTTPTHELRVGDRIKANIMCLYETCEILKIEGNKITVDAGKGRRVQLTAREFDRVFDDLNEAIR